MIIHAAGKSDRGLVRSNNEDAYYVNEVDGIYIVADGMGGHAAGEVAASMLVHITRKIIENVIKENLLSDAKNATVKDLLSASIVIANREIFKTAQENPEKRNMGTTAVVSFLEGTTLHIAWAGDSRAYLYRGGTLKRLTKDHSAVQELLDNNIITEEEALRHPQRNEITNAVGIMPVIEVDYTTINLEPEDYLLLCTDGIFDDMLDSELEELLKEKREPAKTTTLLINESHRHGGKDNATAITMYCVE